MGLIIPTGTGVAGGSLSPLVSVVSIFGGGVGGTGCVVVGGGCSGGGGAGACCLSGK